MTTKLKDDVSPEDFGIPASEAEKARNYAAFLVAEERDLWNAMAKKLMSEVHSSDERYMKMLTTTSKMIDMIQAARNYCAQLETDPCHMTSPEYKEFVTVFGPNVANKLPP
jgi:hypothetical protein